MAHKAAFWRLRHAWTRADRLSALRASPVPAQQPRFNWRPSAIAASFALALAAGGLTARTLIADAPRTFTTEVGGRQFVPLADGSRLELNTATHLRTQVAKDSRRVWLDEARPISRSRTTRPTPSPSWPARVASPCWAPASPCGAKARR
jgi:transmembrane sensor